MPGSPRGEGRRLLCGISRTFLKRKSFSWWPSGQRRDALCSLCSGVSGAGCRILIRKGISPTMGDLGVGNLSSHRIWCRFLKRKDFFFFFRKAISLKKRGSCLSGIAEGGGKGLLSPFFTKGETSSNQETFPAFCLKGKDCF